MTETGKKTAVTLTTSFTCFISNEELLWQLQSETSAFWIDCPSKIEELNYRSKPSVTSDRAKKEKRKTNKQTSETRCLMQPKFSFYLTGIT